MAAPVPAEVTRARIQLMLAQTYFGAAIAAYPVIPADAEAQKWCPAAATDGVYIYVNPEWTAQRSPQDLEFVLAHEVLHCILGHIDRRGDRDPLRWNYAIDYATNQLLVAAGLKAPFDALLDHSFAHLTAEQIYDRLAPPDSASAPSMSAGFDAHLPPDDAQPGALRGSEIPSAEERRRLRKSVGESLKQTSWGRMAGAALEEIQAATEARVDWRAFLAQFLSGIRPDDYRMFPFHRKHLWRGLFMPTLGVPGPKHIAVAVDTSGSMRPSDLALVLGEIDSLRARSQCELTLIHCDTQIQHVEQFAPYNAPDLSRYTFHGRGGTDLGVPFTWLDEALYQNRVEPVDALIYFTDGYGPFPKEAPLYPVLWIVTPQGAKPEMFPFGSLFAI